MHAQTMEGLIGARTNMSLMNVPMRVYKEARQRGDTSTMERAMGYAVDCGEKAKEYKKKETENSEDVPEKAGEAFRHEEENTVAAKASVVHTDSNTVETGLGKRIDVSL